MPNQITHRAHKGRSNKSGTAFTDEPTEREYVIQSMVELEQKRLGRMLTPREIDDIMQRFASTGETRTCISKLKMQFTPQVGL
jgi:hypothetical protein